MPDIESLLKEKRSFKPSPEFAKVREYAARLSGKGGEGRLEYISGNVTDQVSEGGIYAMEEHY